MNSRHALCATLVLACAGPAMALELTVRAHLPDGRPLGQTVVLVESAGADPTHEDRAEAVIDQVNRSFVPHISAIRAGTMVRFPNHDDIRHHVYSFSDAKTFELPLYKGTPAEPVEFGTPGIVTLACNIHDWMLAFVYVTESDWFTVAGDDGVAVLPVADHDRYTVTVWHPHLGQETAGKVFEVVRDGRHAVTLDVEIEETGEPRSRRLRRGANRYR